MDDSPSKDPGATEAGREAAERRREEAELFRRQSEEGRLAAEKLRERHEGFRQQDEGARGVSERLRDAQEGGRELAELSSHVKWTRPCAKQRKIPVPQRTMHGWPWPRSKISPSDNG